MCLDMNWKPVDLDDVLSVIFVKVKLNDNVSIESIIRDMKEETGMNFPVSIVNDILFSIETQSNKDW